jgi:cardiolipin synthase
MKREIKAAKRYIFLEYFIIEEGQMWNGMLEILEQKVKEGLDVRVMYDDLGSFMTLSASYAKKLEEKGIKCIPFNRINPIIGIIMNHRDHRKIMVIDGKTAFSGGVNLADEYINVKVIHGHWKDNVIKIRGNAVWSLTVMFLTIWNAVRHEDSDYGIYRNTWYQLQVTEITNFGDDIPGGWNPDDPTVNPDPTTPVEDDKLYIKVKLLVNKWVASVTTIHLGE